MMRGPIYEDPYVRKLGSLSSGAGYMGPHASYGRGPVASYMQGYPPPPPPHVRPPPYYDYDYGYGGGYSMGYPIYGGYGGYAGGYPSPIHAPRLSRYDPYLDEDLDVPPYAPRYRPRLPTDLGLEDIDYKEKPSATGEEDVSQRPRPRRAAPPTTVSVIEGEKNRRLERLAQKYPSLSDSQTLQDHVDKMRVRLKSLAYSLDPSGPVPEIVIPDRKRPGEDFKQKYTAVLDMPDLPKISTRRHHYYPEDEYLKDNLSIKCLSHYKSTRTAAGYCKARLYQPPDALPKFSSKYSSATAAKWEEPDTVFGEATDRRPFSKVETGSSFFSTYGYTNRMKDTIAEKTTEGEEDEAKKERRKKKKSKERDEVPAIDAVPTEEPTPTVDAVPAEGQAAELAVDGTATSAGEEEKPLEELDEKERKRLEKKKRKAEREAAAKAAMEAELAALAAAEAELARLEAETAALSVADGDAATAPATEATAPPASEPAAEKSE